MNNNIKTVDTWTLAGNGDFKLLTNDRTGAKALHSHVLAALVGIPKKSIISFCAQQGLKAEIGEIYTNLGYLQSGEIFGTSAISAVFAEFRPDANTLGLVELLESLTYKSR